MYSKILNNAIYHKMSIFASISHAYAYNTSCKNTICIKKRFLYKIPVGISTVYHYT